MWYLWYTIIQRKNEIDIQKRLIYIPITDNYINNIITKWRNASSRFKNSTIFKIYMTLKEDWYLGI